jgi:hypothetical protein
MEVKKGIWETGSDLMGPQVGEQQWEDRMGKRSFDFKSG